MPANERSYLVDRSRSVGRYVAKQMPDVHHVRILRVGVLAAVFGRACDEGADLIDERLERTGLNEQRRKASE